MTRRRRRPADIVPLSLCRDGYVIPISTPSETAGGCTDPFQVAFPLADGGALDAILHNAAVSAGHTEQYYDAQGVSRGLSVLGLEFQLHLSLTWSPEAMSPQQPLATSFVVQWAVVVEEMTFNPNLGTRGPTELPNLFSRDEQDLTGKILYRYTDILQFFAGLDTGATSLMTTTNYGVGIRTFDHTALPTNALEGTFGSFTGLKRHRVRSRRRLDENHALFLMLNITTGITPGDLSSDPTLGVSCMGLMKLRGR